MRSTPPAWPSTLAWTPPRRGWVGGSLGDWWEPLGEGLQAGSFVIVCWPSTLPRLQVLSLTFVRCCFCRRAAPPQGMQDLMRENDDGVSVMQWLKSAYQADWDNLLERLKPKLNGLDPR